MSGIDQLGAAMLVAVLVVTPVGLGGALAAFAHPGAAAGGRGRRLLDGDRQRGGQRRTGRIKACLPAGIRAAAGASGCRGG
ncbi:MAG TPA: hypothetical protein VFA45_11115 [Actinomycetes bacterium]|nr:hypothetical protein [Actinomycetes bacterium]